MGDVSLSKVGLEDLLSNFPHFTPGSEEFKRRRLTYCARNPAVPSAILCPRNAEEVAAIVLQLREYNVAFTVRTGGHDVRGRSMVNDTLCIDMRAIDSVEVAKDRKTAVIGGGVQFGKLLTDLHAHGLVTPHGSVPDIGYVGWATLGGYGCGSTCFGLGVDQILDAELVNDKGEIIQADAELLEGIRGACGNFGIITSLRIRVYEVEKYLGGLLMIDTSRGISKVFKDTMVKLQNLETHDILPPEVVLQPLIINHPTAGRTFAITYVWSSNDHYRGQKTLEEIISHIPATVGMNTVAPISPPDWVNGLGVFAPKSVWGGSQAVSFLGVLSAHVLDTIGQSLEDMPSDPATCLALHTLSRRSPSVVNLKLAETSCFNLQARQPHTMVEMVGSAMSQESMEYCLAWSKSTRQALIASGETMRGSYVSVIDPTMMGIEDVYGEKLDFLLSLKRKYDPAGVFKHAVPRLMD